MGRTLLLTGGSGLIGSRIIELIHNKYDLISVDKSPLEGHLKQLAKFYAIDITDKEKLRDLLKTVKPVYILHLAAITDVEGIESKPDIRRLAWRVNVEGTKILSNLAGKLGIPIIYFSTDHIFNGKTGPYSEEDLPDPINEYGRTKLEGEKAVKDKTKNYLIIRLAYPYRAHFEKKSDTVRWMIENLQNKENLELVDDQFITPIFVDDLVDAVSVLIQQNTRGIYHVVGPERLNFYEIGLKIAEVFGFDKYLIRKTTLAELVKRSGRKARQPRDGGLRIDKLLSAFRDQIRLHSIKDSLEEIKRQIKN